jgi:hypothetical protein
MDGPSANIPEYARLAVVRTMRVMIEARKKNLELKTFAFSGRMRRMLPSVNKANADIRSTHLTKVTGDDVFDHYGNAMTSFVDYP